MSPGFQRGDLLFLWQDKNEPIRVGDIIVFQIEGKPIPIVHRILKIHEDENGKLSILTKGDFNQYPDDRGIYNPGQIYLSERHIIGKVKGYNFKNEMEILCNRFLPYIGYVTIMMNDYPSLKYGLIGMMGFFVLVNRE
jgi:signal peptidase